MIRDWTKRLLTAAFLLVAAGVGLPSAHAEFIVEIGGTNQAFTLSSDNLTLGSSQTNSLSNHYGGIPTYSGLNYTTTFLPGMNQFSIVPGAPDVNGAKTYQLNSNGAMQKIDFGNGSSATFALTGGTARVTDANPNVLILNGFLSLVSQTGPIPNGWDFSKFANGSDFTITLTTNASSNNFQTDIDHPAGNDVGGTGSFSDTAVPEPTSLVLLGVGSVGMMCYAWRRRRIVPV